MVSWQENVSSVFSCVSRTPVFSPISLFYVTVSLTDNGVKYTGAQIPRTVIEHKKYIRQPYN